MDIEKLYEKTKKFTEDKNRSNTGLRISTYPYLKMKELALRKRIKMGDILDMAIINLLDQCGVDLDGTPVIPVREIKSKKADTSAQCKKCFRVYDAAKHSSCPFCQA